jgi:hypothetical protein
MFRSIRHLRGRLEFGHFEISLRGGTIPVAGEIGLFPCYCMVRRMVSVVERRLGCISRAISSRMDGF